ncbi:hypothetical protein [Streptomyces sp. NPDC051677]
MRTATDTPSRTGKGTDIGMGTGMGTDIDTAIGMDLTPWAG